MILILTGCGTEGKEEDKSQVQDDIIEEKDENKEEDKFEYVDGFAVVTYDNLSKLEERNKFTDVCVAGVIESVSETNYVLVKDLTGGCWTVGVGTDRDLSGYIGTECSVHGFSNGGISSTYKTPLINMDHEDNRIVFYDGKEMYPKVWDSVDQFDRKDFEKDTGSNMSVWIPTDGGAKYHSRSNCSSMNNPVMVTENDAMSKGYSKCGRCW